MRLTLCPFVLAAIAATGWAVPVDQNAPDGVAAATMDWNANLIILCASGEVMRLNASTQEWSLIESWTPPVPINEIADWGVIYVRTLDGDYWATTNSETPWVQVTLPCSPVRAEGQTLGGVKTQFR